MTPGPSGRLSADLARRRSWLRALMGTFLAATLAAWPALLAGSLAGGPRSSGSESAARASLRSASLPGNAGTLVIGAMSVSLGSAAGDAAGTVTFTSVQPFRHRKATRPGAPAGLVAAAGRSEVSLSWTAPASGPPVTGYHVYQGTSPGGESFNAPVAAVAGTSATVTGLADGTAYYFVVRAVNGAGEGPSSNEASATPVAAQTPPSRGWPLLIILLGAVILAAAAVVALRRLRRPPPPPAPTASVQAVSQADPASVASVHVTGAEPTVTIRIEPHLALAIITIEERRP